VHTARPISSPHRHLRRAIAANPYPIPRNAATGAADAASSVPCPPHAIRLSRRKEMVTP